MQRSDMAALVLAAWSAAGLDIRAVRGRKAGDGFEVSFVRCKGDVCERKTLSLSASRLNGAPTLRLLRHMYLQPAALLAVGGMLFLTYCCCVESELTDKVLSLVQGRAWGWFLLGAAVVAHVWEAAYALRICLRLSLPLLDATLWAIHVAVVGFPVLRWVLSLEETATNALRFEKF